MTNEQGQSTIVIIILGVILFGAAIIAAPRLRTTLKPFLPQFPLNTTDPTPSTHAKSSPTTPLPTGKKDVSPTPKPSGNTLGETAPTPTIHPTFAPPTQPPAPSKLLGTIKIANNTDVTVDSVRVTYCQKASVPQSSQSCKTTKNFLLIGKENTVYFAYKSSPYVFYTFEITKDSTGDAIEPNTPYILQSAFAVSNGKTYFSAENWVKTDSSDSPLFTIHIP